MRSEWFVGCTLVSGRHQYRIIRKPRDDQPLSSNNIEYYGIPETDKVKLEEKCRRMNKKKLHRCNRSGR